MSLALIGKRKFPKRRSKLFGDGRPRPMDRNAKARVMVYARALMRRTEAGKAYGAITATRDPLSIRRPQRRTQRLRKARPRLSVGFRPLPQTPPLRPWR